MKNRNEKNKTSVKLTESAVMISLSIILDLLKLCDLPYGGSVTPASMLPLVIIAFRYGIAWGILSGLVSGCVRFIMGASVLSYVTGAASVTAVILLDYLFAFAFAALGAVFRGLKNKRAALTLGALTAGFVRYICHFVSGVTVWRDISIPMAGAVPYSLAYNATYMIPETAVLMIAAFYVSGYIDVTAPKITVIKKDNEKKRSPQSFVIPIVSGAALAYGIVSVFKVIQGENGFDITKLSEVNWVSVIAVFAAAALICCTVLLISLFGKRKKQ